MTVEKWRVVEICLVCDSKAYANPLTDVDLRAEFQGPGGETIALFGFWDGGDLWKVRFAPTREGTWNYRTFASDLNPAFETAGQIECAAYSGDLDIYKHGFLKKGPQGRYLIHRDGTPFFWLGDTHWTFITEERLNESNCARYKSQFKACVDKRVAQGFTVYQSNFRDGKDFNLFGRYFEFLLETENGFLPNFELLHENVDPKMEYIANAGLVNAVGYSWGNAILKCGIERYRVLAKYLVARYGAYPVIWTLAGEIPGYFPAQAEPMTAVWREIARETERRDGYHNLQSVHLGTNRPIPDIYQGEAWYDFAMSQAGHGDLDMHYNMYADFRERFPACPLVESEGFYEGATTNEIYSRVVTPDMLRRLAYTVMQCGGCGYTYGCNGVWELQWEAGVGGIGWGDMAWWDGLELPGANQMTIFRAFYESVGWQRLRPVNFLLEKREAVNRQFELLGQPLFTADDEMRTVVGYFSQASMKAFAIHTLPFESYLVRWFDPATGEYSIVCEDARPVEGRWELPMRFGARARTDRVLVMTANG
jgi:hypothetical protein